MKNNEYAYRILLEFDKDVIGVTSELKDAFTITSNEYEYIDGPIKTTIHDIEDVITPEPIIYQHSVDLSGGKADNTILFNNNIILYTNGVEL